MLLCESVVKFYLSLSLDVVAVMALLGILTIIIAIACQSGNVNDTENTINTQSLNIKNMIDNKLVNTQISNFDIIICHLI